MTTSAINSNPGICASLIETSKSGANWISNQAKNFSASAGDFFSRMWSAVSGVLSSLAQTLGQWLIAAKGSITSSLTQLGGLSKETKVIAALTLAVSTVTAFVIGKIWNKSSATQAPAANAATQAPAANAATQAPAANAATQAPAAAAEVSQ